MFSRPFLLSLIFVVELPAQNLIQACAGLFGIYLSGDTAFEFKELKILKSVYLKDEYSTFAHLTQLRNFTER